MKKLFLLFSLFLGTHSVWAHDVEVDGIFYNLIQESKSAYVTFEGKEYYSSENEYTGDVVVPQTFTLDGITYSVVGVEGHSFRGCKELTSVKLPNSVLTIGAECFRDCSGLVSVKLSESIQELKSHTFSDCTSLTAIDIPHNVKTIENNCFRSCKALTSITIPKSVTIIGSDCFWGCGALASATILAP